MKINDDPFVITMAGSKINNISSFYEAISLDALGDMLYGRYGLIKSHTAIVLAGKIAGFLPKRLEGSSRGITIWANFCPVPHITKISSSRSSLCWMPEGENLFRNIVAIMLSHQSLRLILL